VLKQLGRLTEAAADSRLALNLPARNPETPKNLIDLSSFYNANLDMHWHMGTSGGYNLAKLPHGETTLDRARFDVRGLVQLGSPSDNSTPVHFPRQVSRIQIGLKCRRIHFLHATGWTEQDGTKIGEYVVNYADGTKRSIDIVYGEDVKNWGFFEAKVPKDLKNATLAWTNSIRSDTTGQLFHGIWENPVPTIEIRDIDYQSTMTTCAPFLIALTVE
jgi:hypothetical protein